MLWLTGWVVPTLHLTFFVRGKGAGVCVSITEADVMHISMHTVDTYPLDTAL